LLQLYHNGSKNNNNLILKRGMLMLHKTDSLIVADFLLRLLRADKRLKYIDGLIRPFVNNEEQGYSINFNKLDLEHSISFALDKDDNIVVYTDISLENKKFFNSNSYEEAKDYIIDTIIPLLSQNKKVSVYLKYNAL
jgi:hypothetical protein